MPENSAPSRIIVSLRSNLALAAANMVCAGIIAWAWMHIMYTRLADLKIRMLAEATKDATPRAEQICTNIGGRLGPLRSARMGVMQIAPAHSTEVSDYGMNDTSSFEKDVRAVVTATFAVK